MDCLFAAAQDHGIGTFQAKHRCVRRNIRSGLINDTDHTDRNRDLFDHKAIWPCRLLQQSAAGIGQRGNILHRFGNILYSFLIQQKPIQHTGTEPVFAAVFKICFIFIYNRFAAISE